MFLIYNTPLLMYDWTSILESQAQDLSILTESANKSKHSAKPRTATSRPQSSSADVAIETVANANEEVNTEDPSKSPKSARSTKSSHWTSSTVYRFLQCIIHSYTHINIPTPPIHIRLVLSFNFVREKMARNTLQYITCTSLFLAFLWERNADYTWWITVQP